MLRASVRGLGWTLISTGVLILLYIVYLLFFTNLRANQAQAELLDEFELEFGDIEQALPGEDIAAPSEAEPVDPGAAYAAMWFERPGSDEPLVRDEPMFLVEGVSLDVLKRGPGHYPESAAPGQVGNFAVAGHRTTYGAPFYRLDDVQAGDEIHVVDRDQREWVYVVRESRIVNPGDLWVVGPDPLGLGPDTAMLTLTTCHPRFSARQRLVVFAELAPPVA